MADREASGNVEEEGEQGAGEKEGEEEEDPLVIDEEKPAEAAPEDVNEAEEDENEKEFEPTVSFLINIFQWSCARYSRVKPLETLYIICENNILGGHDHE